jgi:hypothetical protein
MRLEGKLQKDESAENEKHAEYPSTHPLDKRSIGRAFSQELIDTATILHRVGPECIALFGLDFLDETVMF